MYTRQGYDYLLTFDDEVQQIWKAPSTYFTFIYFIIRYSPFLDSNFMMFRESLSSFSVTGYSWNSTESFLRNVPNGACKALSYLQGCKLPIGSPLLPTQYSLRFLSLRRRLCRRSDSLWKPYSWLTGSTVVLIIRTSAIWEHNRVILTLLILLLLGYTASASYTMHSFLSSVSCTYLP